MNKSTKRRLWIIITLAALVVLADAIFSQAKPVGASLGYDHVLDVWERAWNEILQYTPAGQYYEALLLKHSDEIQALTGNDPVHIMGLWQVAERFVPGMEALLDGKGDTVQITEEQVHALKDEIDWLASAGSPSLRTDIEIELQQFPLEQFIGMTMNEALDYLNANVPPVPTPEPTPINTPPPTSVNQCVAGYDPDCLAGPTLVPNSDGEWAYYVLNGVYFEYPSHWRVELWAGRTDILSLVPMDDSPEGAVVEDIPLFAGVYPDAMVDVYDPLTYPQSAWLRPIPFWQSLVTLPDFKGSEFLWMNDWDTSFIYMEAIFCDPGAQMVMGTIMPIKNDPPNESVHDPELAREEFPNFRHILESFRSQAPEWTEATTPVVTWEITSAIVPNSDGQLAYFILNGVYFEYPSDWDIQQNNYTDEIFFQPTPESPEGKNMSLLAILIYSDQIDDWPENIADLFPAWERPNTKWRELIYLPDFQGFENLWKPSDMPDTDLEFFLYNKNEQIQVGFLARIASPATVEMLTSQEAALRLFPNIHRIIESLRLWRP